MQVGEPELLHQLGGAFFALGGGESLEGFDNGQEVLLDGESLKDAGLLGEVAHAALGAFVHGQVGDVFAGEVDGAAIGGEHADDHAEAGGFSGAVSTEEADDFAAADAEADVVDDHAATEAFDQVLGSEQVR